VQAISKLYTKLLSIDHTIDPNKEVLVTDGAYEALFTGDLFSKTFSLFRSVSMRIRIQLFTSMRIQISIPTQGVKPVRIHSDPDPGQTFAVTIS
jgi:hypothetical protein